jgi:Flp pilus assembly protein TadD
MNPGNNYKCLSIRQPFAWEVCVGEKTVENKPKNASHRGLLLIHAGKKTDGLTVLEELSDWKTYKPYFALGAVVGAAELYDVVGFNRSLEGNLHASGPYCYLLKNPKWFEESIPCSGQLGLFGLPEELTTQVEVQLNKPARTIQVPDDLLHAIRPSRTDSCRYQGQHYLENNLAKDALRQFDEAISFDESNASAYYLKSLAHDQLEQPQEALKAVSEAIRLDAGNPNYRFQRGVYYRALKLLPESTEDFNKVIELEPGLSIGYLFRGINYLLSKDYLSSISDLSQAQNIDPKDVEPKLLKGAVLLESGKLAEGIEELRAAETQFSDDPWPSYFLYCGYTKANQPELAAACLARFKKNDGDEQEVKDYLHDVGSSL